MSCTTPPIIINRTYSCFSDGSLSESVEVDKELLDSDSVLEHDSLETLLNIELNVQ